MKKGAVLTRIVADAREFHHQNYGEYPFVMVSAPGYVNVFGDFTESAPGFLVQFILAQRLVVSLSPRSDNQVRFVSREFNEKKRCTLQTLKYRKEDRWANYPKGALAHQWDWVGQQGINLSIVSDIPINAGFSSSQALTIASVLAVSELRGFRLDFQDAARLANQIESEFVKNNCHPSSFTAMISSKHHEILIHDLKNQKLETVDFVENPQFFLLQTSLPHTVFDGFLNDVLIEIKKLSQYLKGIRPGQTLRDFDKSDIKSLLGKMPEDLRRKALFITDEITRSKEAAHLIQVHDWRTLGRLMIRAHEGLRDLFEISCPEIDWLVKRVSDLQGVYGARMISNGAGSSILVLAEQDIQHPIKSILEEYERIFSFHPVLLPTYPSPKVEFH